MDFLEAPRFTGSLRLFSNVFDTDVLLSDGSIDEALLERKRRRKESNFTTPSQRWTELSTLIIEQCDRHKLQEVSDTHT